MKKRFHVAINIIIMILYLFMFINLGISVYQGPDWYQNLAAAILILYGINYIKENIEEPKDGL